MATFILAGILALAVVSDERIANAFIVLVVLAGLAMGTDIMRKKLGTCRAR